jgi:hypothetical protein
MLHRVSLSLGALMLCRDFARNPELTGTLPTELGLMTALESL